MKRTVSVLLAMLLGCGLFAGCNGSKNDNTVLIYSSAEDYRVAYMQQRLAEEFPDYKITVEYMSTGDHAAKLIAEGKETACDITHDLEYGYLEQLAASGVLADISGYCDMGAYDPTLINGNFYVPECRNGGAVILNPDVLSERGLATPASYQDLLDPQYKGLISMPNPKSSGTGYMFLRNLVNAWGEEEAFAYFDKLTDNILQYTSSGSGPVNALLQKEAAVGLGMTSQAVTKINDDNANLQIVFFKEGSPYSMYGQSVIAGKETKECVQKVFAFLAGKYAEENCEKFFPEKIFKDKTFHVANYPSDITYGDMSNNSPAEKERLLEKWTH